MVCAQEIKSNFNTDAIKPQLKDATGNYITCPFSQVNLHGVPETDQVGSTLNSSGTLWKQPIWIKPVLTVSHSLILVMAKSPSLCLSVLLTHCILFIPNLTPPPSPRDSGTLVPTGHGLPGDGMFWCFLDHRAVNVTAMESSVILIYFPVGNGTNIKSHLTSSKMANTLVKVKSPVMESRDTWGQCSDFACSPRTALEQPQHPRVLFTVHTPPSLHKGISSLFSESSSAKPSQLFFTKDGVSCSASRHFPGHVPTVCASFPRMQREPEEFLVNLGVPACLSIDWLTFLAPL